MTIKERIATFTSAYPYTSMRLVSEDKVGMIPKVTTDYLDMKIVYTINVTDCEEGKNLPHGNKIVYVTPMLLEQWGITEGILYREITAKMEKDNDLLLMNLMEMMNKFMGSPVSTDINPDDPIVVTNSEGVFGAVNIILPEVQKRIFHILGSGYFILPSSVHEVIILRDDIMHVHDMLSMVREINAEIVDEYDKLSDNIYHYNPITNMITIYN